MKIIIVNVAVWVTLRVIAIIAMLFASPGLLGTALSLVEIPSRPVELLLHPWTLLTYMFAQFDLLHILFNMLWLYWFGVIFMQLSVAAATAARLHLRRTGRRAAVLCELQPVAGLCRQCRRGAHRRRRRRCWPS